MFHATHHNFIQNQLNTIKNVYDDNKLEYVCLKSDIDTSFGRTYIRWTVDIELKDGFQFTYRRSDEYQSYQLWDRNYSAYKIFNECERDLWKVNNYFDELFTEYNNDLSRFVELFKMAFPDVKLYNFISKFDFLPCGLNGFDVYMSDFDWINYMALIENGFHETSIGTTRKEEIDKNHHFIFSELEQAEELHKDYKEREES